MNNKVFFYSITQSNIDRVSKPKIFNNKLDEYIQNSCKRVLYKSMERIDGYKNDEVAEMIDLQGNLKLTLYGKNGRVDTNCFEYDSSVMKSDERSLIFIHNHPNNSSLSLNDLVTFMSDLFQLVVIVVTNSGNINYAVKIDQNIKYNKISMYIYKRTNKHELNNVPENKVRNIIFNNPTKYGLRIGRSNRRRVKQ